MPLIESNSIKLVKGFGPKDAKIVIVGEAPGAEEEKYGKPFVGSSGKLLESILQKVGLVRREVYITNVVKERPPKNDISVFFKSSSKLGFVPTDKAKQYIEHLKAELEELNPNIIVALGAVSAWVLTGKTGITKIRGSIYPSTLIEGKKVIPIIHPSAALRQYIFTYMIEMDFERVVKESKFPEIRTIDRIYRLEPTFSEACDYLEDILNYHKRVAFDIEVVNKELGCFSFAKNKADAMVIPFYKDGKSCFDPDQETQLLALTSRILEKPDLTIIGQNLVFDGTFMFHKYGIAINNIDDTMIAHAILYPDLPKGLDFITSHYTSEPYYKDDGKQWMRIGGNIRDFWIYNAKDSLVCIEAMPKLKEDLIKFGLLETYKQQKELIYPLIFMSEHGIRMNVEGMDSMREELELELTDLMNKFSELTGDVNPNSPKQLVNYFYIQKGYKPYINRKSGRPSVDMDALKRLARKGSEEALILLKYRKLAKLKSTYIDVTLDSRNRLTCSFNPVGTKQGRLSSSKNIFGEGTNLQNQPAQMKKFMLADEGYLLFDVDLSQAENRIVAYVAPETKMINAFETEMDVHSLTASLIFNEPIEQIIEEHNAGIPCELGTGDQTKRFWGKKANHGLNYGLGYKTFALYYELPEKDAKFIVERYHQAYPGVRGYHQWVKMKLRASRTLENLMGRKRLFLDRWGDELFKQAYSFIPQSTVADIINFKGILLIYNDPMFKEFVLLNQVHDSIVFQVPISLSLTDLFTKLNALKQSLETPLTYNNRTFFIPADFKVGLNLKDVKTLDLENIQSFKETIQKILNDETQTKS